MEPMNGFQHFCIFPPKLRMTKARVIKRKPQIARGGTDKQVTLPFLFPWYCLHRNPCTRDLCPCFAQSGYALDFWLTLCCAKYFLYWKIAPFFDTSERR